MNDTIFDKPLINNNENLDDENRDDDEIDKLEERARKLV